METGGYFKKSAERNNSNKKEADENKKSKRGTASKYDLTSIPADASCSESTIYKNAVEPAWAPISVHDVQKALGEIASQPLKNNSNKVVGRRSQGESSS